MVPPDTLDIQLKYVLRKDRELSLCRLFSATPPAATTGLRAGMLDLPAQESGMHGFLQHSVLLDSAKDFFLSS